MGRAIGRAPPVFAGVDALVALVVQAAVAVLADVVVLNDYPGRTIHRSIDENAIKMIAGDEVVADRRCDRAKGGRVAIAPDFDAVAAVEVDVVGGDAEVALLESQAIAAVVVNIVVVDYRVAAEDEDSDVVAAANVVAIDQHAGRLVGIDPEVAAGDDITARACAG